ncbi:hypothetical protein BKA67DRAFT_584630 [Truncatella angustata]|uniref:Uncharacterized protein n=1 Tax=Truncatella angustata TaxID=152316 RepID=A0A9P8UBD2_9PEZI|nr:uncharacterized protein BKA67DRAFT_584630 [Truncatella angustata]KAH6645246.1 hypothetical protein BKA67DRAFT_584630 [Truncatella angustata]KAH8200600.1 hypothetical protein TruAng_005252 [Truncatella angustata]
MLPKPSLCFTIPSIHDNTKLDCRVFHPLSLSFHVGASGLSQAAPPWGRHIAIVAHPYAPLGGCYDDPIVNMVAGILLRSGFLVATFNFRGVSSAGARTSWTSKPEQADYMSVVGFLAYYAHYIEFPKRTDPGQTTVPILLQAGYSYGAMVTTKLPPLNDIMAPFESPPLHSAAADIRLRAQHLAEQQTRLATGPASPRRSMGLRVGGDEDVSRRSHDFTRTHSPDHEDKIRRGVKDLLARTKRVQRKHGHKHDEQAEEHIHQEECMVRVDDLEPYRSAYLLVSPPIGYLTNLATMSFPSPFASWHKKGGRSGHGASSPPQDGAADTRVEPHDLKLVHNPTLAIYGDQDGFLMPRKLREWTTRLKAQDGSLFHDIEVAGAGHFWAEEGVVSRLRAAVSGYGSELLGSTAQSFEWPDD